MRFNYFPLFLLTLLGINLTQPLSAQHHPNHPNQQSPCPVFIGISSSYDTLSGGAKIFKIFDDTPASRSLKMNDIVMAINGVRVANPFEIIRERDKCKPGENFTMTILRNGQELQIRERFRACTEAEIAAFDHRNEMRKEKEAELERMAHRLKNAAQVNPCKGDVNIGLTHTYNYFNEPRNKGLLIQTVLDNSPGSRAGLQKGDILLAFNGQEVNSNTELIKERNKNKPGDTFTMTVQRSGSVFTLDGQFDSCPEAAERNRPTAAPAPLAITPNPSTGLFNMSWETPESSDCQIQVTDLSGRIILQQNIQTPGGRFTQEVNLLDAPDGIYMITLQSGNQKVTEKVVKRS